MSRTKNEWKNEVCAFLLEKGAKRENLAKALKIIKEAAWNECKIDADFLRDPSFRKIVKDRGFSIGDTFYPGICWNFGPGLYPQLHVMIQELEEILGNEAEAEYALEAKISAQIEEATGEFYNWNEHLYDELGAPDFAIVIYKEYLEVRAYEAGVGNRIPKAGRKYVGSQGDIRWHYPLSSLAALENLGAPIVTAPY